MVALAGIQCLVQQTLLQRRETVHVLKRAEAALPMLDIRAGHGG